MNSSMSKKAAVAGCAISAIAASNDLSAQVIIAIVGIVSVITQAILDHKGKA